MSAYESGLFEAVGGGDDPHGRPDGGTWPLILASPESHNTAGSIECRRCGTELLVGVSGAGDFEVAELLALVDDHAPVCPGVSGIELDGGGVRSAT